jgi:hypothetical protein
LVFLESRIFLRKGLDKSKTVFCFSEHDLPVKKAQPSWPGLVPAIHVFATHKKK